MEAAAAALQSHHFCSFAVKFALLDVKSLCFDEVLRIFVFHAYKDGT
jgi:hypothetical protein